LCAAKLNVRSTWIVPPARVPANPKFEVSLLSYAIAKHTPREEDIDGRCVPLSEQDRAQWSLALIALEPISREDVSD
jgi:hypothetical protein